MLPENFHPHSRYILKEAPWGYNAKDLIHNDVNGPVFDLGVDLDDRFGIAYLRVSDVEEMARVLGMATRDEVAALKRQIKELNAEVTNVPREVEKLKDGLSELVADFLDRVVDRPDSDGSVPSEERAEEIAGQLELPISGESEDSEDSGDESDASLDKGPAKLPSGIGDEFGFGFSK